MLGLLGIVRLLYLSKILINSLKNLSISLLSSVIISPDAVIPLRKGIVLFAEVIKPFGKFTLTK
jgi:hypothetical protein